MKRLILTLFCMLILVGSVNAAWWNTNWDSKRMLEFQENNGTTIINYSVAFYTQHLSGMQDDFDDVRFLDASETVELPYYLENKSDGNYANFFVKINLTANQNTTIYMYFQNLGATSNSSISDAFIFGDNFSTNTTSSYNFSGNCTNVSIQNDILTFAGGHGGASPVGGPCTVAPLVQSINESYIVEANASYSAALARFGVLGFLPTLNSTKEGYAAQHLNTQFDIEKYLISQLIAVSQANDPGPFYHYKAWFKEGNITATIQNDTAYITLGTTDSTYLGGAYGMKAHFGNVSVQWFRARRTIENEPTVTLGAIENEAFTENSQTFNSTTLEFSSESFILNITYNSTQFTSISSTLIYNGTSYLGTTVGTGDSLTFERTITIPTLSANSAETKSFFWNVIYSNSTDTLSQNSSTQSQTVNPILFSKCNSTFGPKENPIAVNFSIYTESNRTPLNASMKASFYYSIGETDNFKTNSFESVLQNHTFDFCVNSNETFNIDATIRIEKDGYHGRTYYYNDRKYNNQTTDELLFLLNSSLGTRFIIQVKDPGSQPLEDYSVNISRFYPETNEYIEVISEITDEFGQFVVRLIEENVKYRFTFFDEEGTLVKTTEDVSATCAAVFCVFPFVLEDTVDEFVRFDNITNFQSSLDFSNETNLYTLSWNDITTGPATIRLLVERLSLNGTTIICNNTSTAKSGTMTCNVGSDAFSYRAQGFRRASGEEELRIEARTDRVGDPFGVYNFEGMIWSFILLFTLIAVGSYNPIVGVILYMVGFIGLGYLGIFSFNLAVLFGMLVLGILFIIAFQGRR